MAVAVLPPPGLEDVVPFGVPSLTLSDYLPNLALVGSTDFSPAYVPVSHDRGLLARENAELLRMNTELRAQMTLMQENAALAQAKALLEKQIQTAKTVFEGGPSEGHMAGERLSRKERRREFMRRKTLLGQCKVTAASDIQSDTMRAARYPVLLGARSRLSSVSTGIDMDESTSEDSEAEQQPSRQSSRKAAMMRNIPLEYTREDVLELIDDQGFQGSYELFYLPIVFQSQLNHGYAFILFTEEESYERFREHFSGFSDWKVPSDRTCEVSFSDKFSDLEDRIEYYRNSPIMHESVEEQFKPILFEAGQRVPFPEPNKTVKAPKRKKSFP